jgi:hypothetical protein
MNVHQVLRLLYAEKEKLDRVLASLEELQAISSHTRRPGRKYMSKEERRKVSARMKRIWAKHKKRQQGRPYQSKSPTLRHAPPNPDR